MGSVSFAKQFFKKYDDFPGDVRNNELFYCVYLAQFIDVISFNWKLMFLFYIGHNKFEINW